MRSQTLQGTRAAFAYHAPTATSCLGRNQFDSGAYLRDITVAQAPLALREYRGQCRDPFVHLHQDERRQGDAGMAILAPYVPGMQAYEASRRSHDAGHQPPERGNYLLSARKSPTQSR